MSDPEPRPPMQHAPGVPPPFSALDHVSGIAPPAAENQHGDTATARSQHATGTHRELAPGATPPADATGGSLIDVLELVALVIDLEGGGIIHAYGYDEATGACFTVCGLPCDAWEVLVGGHPTCEVCSLARVTL